MGYIRRSILFLQSHTAYPEFKVLLFSNQSPGSIAEFRALTSGKQPVGKPIVKLCQFSLPSSIEFALLINIRIKVIRFYDENFLKTIHR